MTSNFLWVLKGIAATFEGSLSIESLHQLSFPFLPKYVADKSIFQMEGSVKTKKSKIVDFTLCIYL